MPLHSPEENSAHWRATRNLTIGILVIWAIFAFLVHIFAGWLNQFTVMGFPLGYFMAVQGSLAAFVILIFFQNWRQDQIDEEFGHDD